PGLNGWTIYVDQNTPGQFDPPVPDQHLHGAIDAGVYVPGSQILDPTLNATLTLAGAGTPVLAKSDPNQPAQQVFAFGLNAVETSWQDSSPSGTGKVLRVDFAHAVQTVAIDFLRASSASAVGVLRAYNASGTLLQE